MRQPSLSTNCGAVPMRTFPIFEARGCDCVGRDRRSLAGFVDESMVVVETSKRTNPRWKMNASRARSLRTKKGGKLGKIGPTTDELAEG